MFELTEKHYSNMHDIINYTASAMKVSGYSYVDIQDFLVDATSGDNNYLIDLCLDMLDECNKAQGYYNV